MKRLIAAALATILATAGSANAGGGSAGGGTVGGGLTISAPWVTGFTNRRLLTSSGTHDAYSSSTDYIEVTGLDTTSGFQADCDDLQVYYWNGSTNTQVKRKVTGCNSTSTKVYFKIPYSLSANANLASGADRIYLYGNNGSATCGAGCSDYVNTNFPQAALTPATNTQMLYDFETTTGCNVCTGDASYNDRGCTTNGDCGTGTCTATVDLCDMSGIQTPHHLDGCNSNGTDCSSQPSPEYAPSARIGDKSLRCGVTDGTISYRAIEPNFDDSNMNIVTIDWWVNNQHTEHSSGARNPFGTDNGLGVKYADVGDEAAPWYWWCDEELANNDGTCTDNNDCCFSSEPSPCGYDAPGTCGRNDTMILTTLMSSAAVMWTDLHPVPVGTWMHFRWVIDNQSSAQRWRGWKNGVAIDYMGNSGWISPGDCTAAGTPYTCCTDVDAGCRNITNISNTTSNFLVCNKPGSTQDWWGYQDELRISTADLGAPDWVTNQVTVVPGALEALTQDGVAPTDWTSSMGAVWLFEEAAGQNAIDSAGGDDTLNNNGTTGRVAGIQGTKAADLLGATNWFGCPDATCRRTDPAAGTSFSYGGWVYSTDADTTEKKYALPKTTFASGYWLARVSGSPAYMECYVRSTVTPFDHYKQDATAISNNSWEHFVCTVSDATDVTYGICRDGSCSTSVVSSADYVAVTNTNPFYVSGNETFFLDGYYDEIFFDDAAWTSIQAARVCSIGMDGSLGRCDSGTPANYLACNSNEDCGGTALCATGASATDNTYCVEGTKAGCCMGRNVSYCGGNDLAACNASAP